MDDCSLCSDKRFLELYLYYSNGVDGDRKDIGSRDHKTVYVDGLIYAFLVTSIMRVSIHEYNEEVCTNTIRPNTRVNYPST